MNKVLAIISSFAMTLILLISLVLPVYAVGPDKPSSVSEVVDDFSNKFCVQISKGETTEGAGKLAAKEMIQGLMFSPVLKEIMATPQEEIVASLSTQISLGCGQDLGVTEVELNDYLLNMASNRSTKPHYDPLKQLGVG